ncbi:single-stranded DNA-binding protein [Streptococcus oralis subsp. dentisani]|uniref:Single-stranded DNA-binding protein n=1 Tax=Streptococcus oralis subsp. dentisani TaxID=1458253 RepID=A0A2I1UGI4_STROR|nr:single-stranded DNA-binding protein [Streptococcus oralis subsp. dentisani]
MILSEKITWDFFNQENSSLGNFFLTSFLKIVK